MQFDPNRSSQEWIALLRRQAEEAWGPERAAGITAAIDRLGQAIARVAARVPSRDAEPAMLRSEPSPRRPPRE